MKGKYVSCKDDDLEDSKTLQDAQEEPSSSSSVPRTKATVLKEEYREDVESINAFFGSRANYVLSQFVKRYLEGYKCRGAKTEIEIVM